MSATAICTTRGVGLARVANGKLIEPNNFGEVFLLTGRSTIVTDSVSVIADGTDGKPAIIRARGKLHPLPFFESIIGVVFQDAYQDVDWDTKFTLVEVFNDSGWLQNRSRNVADWLGLLRAGRKVFAVGSSDSHGLVGSPVGYPRTCITLGTDDPRRVTPSGVRDQLAAGRIPFGVTEPIFVVP